MNQSSSQPLHPLYRRPTTDEIPAQRFEGDLYERADLAKRLTEMLGRLPDGAVLSIDSPWGEGKTWFGRRWQAQLIDQGFRTAYIDCFQRDHLDDPFGMLAGELLELARAGKSQARIKLLEAGKKIGASLLPAAAKFAVNTVGHWAIGKADLAEDVGKGMAAIEENGAEKLEKLVAATLENYEREKRSVDGFKLSLSELAAETEKPIVIFVDELDRCRPDFAVRTIERIKHFFDVPGVVFVLLINRRQIVAAIRGLYGQEVDADAYLGKFIQLGLTLPKRTSTKLNSPDDNRQHCQVTLVKYGFPASQANMEFSQVLGVLASLLNLSLRDIERAVVLFSFGQPINSSAAYLAWPIALKLSKPDLFARLVLNDKSAHFEAYKLAAQLREKSPENLSSIIQLVEEMHNSGSQDFSKELPPELAQMLSAMMRIGGVERLFRWLFSRVDLSISE